VYSDLTVIKDVLDIANVLNSKWKVCICSYEFAKIALFHLSLMLSLLLFVEARAIGLHRLLRYPLWQGRWSPVATGSVVIA